MVKTTHVSTIASAASETKLFLVRASRCGKDRLGARTVFVLYGERGLRAFEVKMAQNVRPDDLRGLLRFRADFPQAKAYLLYLGNRRWHDSGVEVLPFVECVAQLDHLL